jgi:hypothetical protein
VFTEVRKESVRIDCNGRKGCMMTVFKVQHEEFKIVEPPWGKVIQWNVREDDIVGTNPLSLIQ